MATKKNIFNDAEICFDLQFRRDVRRDRTNQPTYYRWKMEFAVTAGYKELNFIKQIQKTLNCGKIHFPSKKNQIRYSVQNIDSLWQIIVPYFKTHKLAGNKQKDFESWAKAIEIISQNKGKILASWKRNDFLQLIEIQKNMQKFKGRNQQRPKWLNFAQTIADSLKS